MKYHDKEWGVPAHADNLLFEFLTLEGAQAGLSWLTVLKKRENYRIAFAGFDPDRVAGFEDDKVKELKENPGIIRNELKIRSTIQNANKLLLLREEFGSFDEYVWKFVDNKPMKSLWKSQKQIPAKSSESDIMSKDLKQRGFTFVGSTICYSFMQAVGLVNDHLATCFRVNQV